MAQTFDPEQILQLPLMANLATASRDGPRNAPVWFIWENRALWLLSSKNSKSVIRLHDDPKCAVEIVHYDNIKGILLHLGLRGEASIEPSSSNRFRRLLTKYLGEDESSWNEWFVENIARIDDPSTRMIKLIPSSIFTNNVSFFRTGPELAWPDGL